MTKALTVLFLVETVAIGRDAVSSDFGFSEIVCAFVIAAFMLGTFGLLVFIPLGLLVGYGCPSTLSRPD